MTRFRNKTGDTLREDQQRFRQMADNAPVLIWISGTDKLCTWFNKPWLEFVGRSMEQEIGNGWAENVHQDDFDRCLQTYSMAFDARQPFSMEYRVRRHDAVYRWVLDKGVPLHGPDGAFTGYIGSCVDITERRQVEEELRQSQVHLQLTTEAAQVGTWQWNLETNEVFWSAIHKRLWGYETTPDPIRYADWASRVHKEDLGRVEEAIETCMRGTADYDIEYRINPRGATAIRWIRSKGRANYNKAGEATLMQGVSLDITERKQAEGFLAEAMRQKEALYQFVEQRQRARSLEEIYAAALDAIRSALSCERASILLYDASGVMRFVAWHGLSDDYRKATDGHSPWSREEPNPRPLCIADVAASNLDDLLKAVVSREGIGALAFIPLLVSGRLVGKFMIYYDEPHRFDDEELEMCLTISGQLALGIERMRAEEALRNISLLPAQNPAPVLRVAPSGEVLFANPAALEALEEWDLAVGETVPAALLEMLDAAWHASQAYVREQTVAGRFYTVTITPVPEANYANLYWSDITERKHVEDALRESEERFRTLADHMSQFAWMADEKGWIFWYNRRWYEYTGTTLEEMQGWGWTKVHHPDHVDRVVQRIQRSWDTGEVWEDVFPLRGKDGEYRWFLSRALPIRDPDGRIARWFGTNTDVTEQREVEESIRQLARDLDERVAQRTQELQQANLALLRDMEERKKLEEQLLQAQKMEGIGTLAGGIAHDFNNILNIIQGYASSLSNYGAQNGEVGDCLAVINETVQRGSALVQQLLTLARKNGTQWEAVDANAVIEKLIALIAQTFPKNIELSSSLEPDLPPIRADKNQLEQALLNLCVNARDAMPNGGKLFLRTQAVEGPFPQDLGDAFEASRYVSIEVSDNGTGMDESIRTRIFEPFFTTKNTGQGTGLGLSVVYGIVKSHKGAINVESRPDCGTVFKLAFPVLQASPKAMIEARAPINDESEHPANSGAAILLVEDEKHMLDLMEKILRRYGYRVFTAIDGEQALEVYHRHGETIDVVLLDIGLPKITGLDVLRILRQQTRHVSVVIATGYLDPELKSEISQLGVQHFVDKPYRFDQLLETLQGLIENKLASRQEQLDPA